MALETEVFVLPRRGLLGSRPMGADYMRNIEKKAKRMRKACRCGVDPPEKDSRQLLLFHGESNNRA